jgi:hypothetical protein
MNGFGTGPNSMGTASQPGVPLGVRPQPLKESQR